ncbi:8-oxo-dGTP diphosphatase [Flexivirga sp. ID2601S]|uniref:Oxidized purine nucleoside triphosphate hydrolase n=1 Tax=Flexivirga aerilata TaxID=1656889 RepID=A0A849AH92_9MICO|nr:8-oxo-dGTP diphosphatase [Flexivirga aerilata]
MTKSTCLAYLIRDDGTPHAQVLLGEKLRGFGAGRVVALGGHVEPGESSLEAAVRETREESGLLVAPDDFAAAGQVRFRWADTPAWDMDVDLFRATRWTGDIVASDELEPEWWPVADLPLCRMWDDARICVPFVLRGDAIDAEIAYDAASERVVAVALRVLGRSQPLPGGVTGG